MKISNSMLAAVINSLLTDQESAEIDDMSQFERFCTDLAQVVCDHCGGEIIAPATYQGEPAGGALRDAYALELVRNDCSPDGDDVWTRVAASLAGSGRILASLDGGLSYRHAPAGVRLIYREVGIGNEGEVGEVHLNATRDGLITDIWTAQESDTPQHLGTDSVMIDDIVGRLVQPGESA